MMCKWEGDEEINMAKRAQVIHCEVIDSSGHTLSNSEKIKLSNEQLDWLADFFMPIVSEGLKKDRIPKYMTNSK